MKLGRPEDPETALGPLIFPEHKHRCCPTTPRPGTRRNGGDRRRRTEMPGALAGAPGSKPTIWTGLDDSSPIAREEVFGPAP